MTAKKPTTGLRKVTRAQRTPLTKAARERKHGEIERKHEAPNDEAEGRRGGLYERAGGRETRRRVAYLPPELDAALEQRTRERKSNVSDTICSILADVLKVRLKATG